MGTAYITAVELHLWGTTAFKFPSARPKVRIMAIRVTVWDCRFAGSQTYFPLQGAQARR